MLTKTNQADILAHYQACLPKECCGLLVKTGRKISYQPCNNLGQGNDVFILDPKDWVQAEAMGNIVAIVHSHPNGDILPSDSDKVQMQVHGLPWVITNGKDFDTHYPTPFTAPLVGREYHHGVLDCFAIVRDYFEREHGIKIDDFERSDAWWEDPNSPSLYLENFEAQGFLQVDDLQPHDVILCRVGKTHHVNHALIYLGDYQLQSEDVSPTLGDIVLHHPYGGLSRREIYGENWQRRAVITVRHKDFV